MPSYIAPVEDMMFLFEKLRDNKKYNELEKYKEVSSDLVKDILEEAAKINQNLILPLAKAGDENPAVLENGVVRTPPGYKEAYKKYIEDGWIHPSSIYFLYASLYPGGVLTTPFSKTAGFSSPAFASGRIKF